MVGLVVETPLAQHDVGTTVLNHLYHVYEVLLLLLVQLLIIISTSDVDVVFGLGLWRLECAGQYCNLSIVDNFLHLGMTDVLVDQYSVDQFSVFNRTASLGLNLDEIQIHVSSLQVAHRKHCLNSDLSKLLFVL